MSVSEEDFLLRCTHECVDELSDKKTSYSAVLMSVSMS